MGSEPSNSSRKAIAAAAVQCFERFGVHRTSMRDVADQAGVSRQTVYRVFPSRSELLAFILADRIATMGETLEPYFAAVPTLQDALVEGSIVSMRARRDDALFAELVAHGGDHSLEQFLFRGSKDIQRLLLSFWGPVLDKARASGELRAGISIAQAVEWIRNQHALLGLRDDYDEDMQRYVLATFVVPSLVNQEHIAPTLTKKKTQPARRAPAQRARKSVT